MKEGGTGQLIFFLHLIVGLYLVNVRFNLVDFSKFTIMTELHPWILLAGGALIIFAGINYLRSSGRRRYRD
jgi:hypothetical protein